MEFQPERHTREHVQDFLVLRMNQPEAELLVAVFKALEDPTRQFTPEGIKLLVSEEVQKLAKDITALAKDQLNPAKVSQLTTDLANVQAIQPVKKAEITKEETPFDG